MFAHAHARLHTYAFLAILSLSLEMQIYRLCVYVVYLCYEHPITVVPWSCYLSAACTNGYKFM